MNEMLEKFLQLEKKYNLFNYKIKNVFFWKILRLSVWHEIIMKKGFYEIPPDSDKINNKMSFFGNCIKNSFTNEKTKKEIIFLEADRFYTENGIEKSIYLESMYESYLKNEKSFEVIYPFRLDKKYRRQPQYQNENLKYLFIKFSNRLREKFYFFSAEESNFFKNLKEDFEKEFNISNIEIFKERALKREIINFEGIHFYYKKLFQAKEVKEIFLVCSYGREPVIAAAQCLNIQVTELQHGGITNTHLGYSFPKNDIPYFPNTIFIFGEHWKKNEFSENTKIEIYGYPYLRKQIEKYKNLKKERKQILFISQGTIGKVLSQKALEFAKDNPEMKVIYKLHPGEFKCWKNRYPELYENRSLQNLEISDNNEKNLYYYLCQSSYLIGVYSTVIYEALELGLKIGILKLFGYEGLEYFIAQNNVYLFNCKDKIEIIALEKLNTIKKGYLFK